LPNVDQAIWTDFVIRDSGQPDEIAPDAEQHSLQQLPVETLVYLLGSRYCETDARSVLYSKSTLGPTS
jgi:hypothetical protein